MTTSALLCESGEETKWRDECGVRLEVLQFTKYNVNESSRILLPWSLVWRRAGAGLNAASLHDKNVDVPNGTSDFLFHLMTNIICERVSKPDPFRKFHFFDFKFLTLYSLTRSPVIIELLLSSILVRSFISMRMGTSINNVFFYIFLNLSTSDHIFSKAIVTAIAKLKFKIHSTLSSPRLSTIQICPFAVGPVQNSRFLFLSGLVKRALSQAL